MIWIDIVSLVLILIFVLFGLWRGIIYGLFKMCAWIFAIVGAYFSQIFLADFIANNLDISGFSVKIVCLCIGFLIPFLIFQFLGRLTNEAVKKSSINGVNRALGAVLGVFKAYVIFFIFLTILHLLPVSGALKTARNDSLSYAFYKANLEFMGFSSEEINLVEIAERKATEFSEEVIHKATEKAKEAVQETIEEKLPERPEK